MDFRVEILNCSPNKHYGFKFYLILTHLVWYTGVSDRWNLWGRCSVFGVVSSSCFSYRSFKQSFPYQPLFFPSLDIKKTKKKCRLSFFSETTKCKLLFWSHCGDKSYRFTSNGYKSADSEDCKNVLKENNYTSLIKNNNQVLNPFMRNSYKLLIQKW